MEQKDVVIIGGGPAGLAAAVELHKQGIRNMIILEREAALGGILRQCRLARNDGGGVLRNGRGSRHQRKRRHRVAQHGKAQSSRRASSLLSASAASVPIAPDNRYRPDANSPSRSASARATNGAKPAPNSQARSDVRAAPV